MPQGVIAGKSRAWGHATRLQFRTRPALALAEFRNDLLPIGGNDVRLVAIVEVDVELCDADILQLFDLLDVIFRLPQHAETIDDVVGDEVQIGVVALTML